MKMKHLLLLCACALSPNLHAIENEGLSNSIANLMHGDRLTHDNMKEYFDSFKKDLTTGEDSVDDTYKGKPMLNIAIEEYIDCLDKGKIKHIQNGQDIISVLLKQNPHINNSDNNGNTALHMAVSPPQGGFYSREFFKESIFKKNKNKKHLIKDASNIPRLKHLLSLLLEHGANINAQNNDNNTPLHLAILAQSPAIVTFLIENGADIDFTNKKGLRPYDIALEYAELKKDELNTKLKDGLDATTTQQELNAAKSIVHILNKEMTQKNLQKIRKTEKQKPEKSTANVGFKFE